MRSAALLILAACSSPTPAPPATAPPSKATPVCSTAKLDRDLAAYPGTPQADMVAAYLAESCPALPEPVRTALRQFVEAGPEHHVAEHAALEHPDVWAHSCRD